MLCSEYISLPDLGNGIVSLEYCLFVVLSRKRPGAYE